MATPATDKQKGFAFALAREMGYGASDYIDARLGKAMGLSMRARSGAGRLGTFIEGLTKYEASQMLDNLVRAARR